MALAPTLGETTPRSGALTPLIKWAGGKRALLPHILRVTPQDATGYAEPFLGGGALFLALGTPEAVLNDANPDLIQMYEAVRDNHEGVAAALDELQALVQDQAAFYRIRSEDPTLLCPAERAARFIYLNKTGYNGLYRVNRRGAFNVPFGYRASPPALYERSNLKRVAQLLQTSTIRHGDFEPILEEAAAGCFVYADPPYAPVSATASFTKYTADAFLPPDQERLARAVRRAAGRGVKVLVSNSDVEFVRDLYSGFPMVSIIAERRINSDASKRSGTRELLIRTYD